MMIKKAHVVLSIAAVTFLVALVPVTFAQAIPVPSDPSATYSVIALKKMGAPMVHITTSRDGRSGKSFSKREVNCKAMRFRYLGTGDSLKEIRASKPFPNMGPLVRGSISYYVSQYACRKLGVN